MSDKQITPQQAIAAAKAGKAQIVDIRFTDLFGTWQHFSIPVNEFTEELFKNGIGFDGSSIRGFQQIHESDMLLIPDATTTFMDPVLDIPTLVIICDIYDPVTLEPYSRDPRYVARKANDYMIQSGIADLSYWGPEAEFFIFDDVKYESTPYSSYYAIDSREGWWNSGEDLGPNLGGQIQAKRGYFPVPPVDTLQDVRSDMMLTLQAAGIPVEAHHHEVASAGQSEIDLRYDTLLNTSDNLLKYKYLVRTVARRHGLTATFMPKPLFEDNGSGMHLHTSLWKNGKNVFYDKSGYAQLSDKALHYIGGLLKHAPALLALAAPTTNSYRRLVPGFEAPVNLAYSQRNRSAIIRLPTFSKSEKATRVEFRAPDPTCNPYLACAALLMAGLDGIENQIDPGEPMDKDLYDLPPEELANVPQVPGSLAEVLDELENNHNFLLKGNVFTPDLIENYIAYKRENEVDAVRLRTHPHEFSLYFDS